MAHVVSNLKTQGACNLAWEDLCEAVAAGRSTTSSRVSNADSDVNTKYPPKSWTTKQLLGRVDASYRHENDTRKDIVSLLRPEDATHVPQIRIDGDTGTVADWNRSLTDLTGIARSDVVGRKYDDILRDMVPALSEEYRNAAVNWVTRSPSPLDTSQHYYDGPEDLREDHLWPLPLPLRGPNDTSNSEYCYFVELLATRADTFSAFGYRVKPSYKLPERDQETEGWLGGLEFTLRRSGIPSLQSLCKAIVPQDYTNPDGSRIALDASTESSEGHKTSVKPWYEVDASLFSHISTQIRSRAPAVLKYMREVLYHVRTAMRKMVVNKKVYTFTEDWTKNSDTAELSKIVFEALGGDEIIEQGVVRGGKLTWKLAFAVGGSKLSREEKRSGEIKRCRWERTWEHFMEQASAVVGEHSYPICRASDAPYIVPTSEDPKRVMLTLKIEGIEQSCGSYEDEPLKSWAVVRVPATLNFFQLHRVVVQVMTCSSSATRTTHVWKCKNFASRFETYTTDRKFHYVQLGETYFVEDGSRTDYGCSNDGLFEEGKALRQRVSRTAAYYDQEVPLSFEDHSFMQSGENDSVGKLRACIHSTCINAVFFQPGTEVYLEDGLVKYCTKYKISCMRIDAYDGPLPKNPDINAFLPKCLRGKADDDEYKDWSVDEANAQLEADRGCLRRILCRIDSKGCMQQMPWCWTRDGTWLDSHDGQSYPKPLATSLVGLDLRPIYLHGEPPLPNSSRGDYSAYVSSLEGRIDPNFLQENVVDDYGQFSVPFGRVPSYRRYRGDSDEESSQDDSAVWEREVDEEMKRIEDMQPKSKPKSSGKKRKSKS